MDRTIWLIRHASRHDFADPRWVTTAPRGYDPPLSETGRREAIALADRLAGEAIDGLFSSPFLRCVETADALAGRLGLRIRIESGLSEWLCREWFPDPPVMLAAQELARRFPAVDAASRSRGAARYGESGEEALHRSAAVARAIAAEYPGSLAMVGHAASMLGAAMGLLELDRPALPDFGYGDRMQLVQRGARWTRVAGPVSPFAPADGT